MTKYISAADTAKLARQILKEAFPGVKFSVRSKTYSGGASIDIGWTDGPVTSQVESQVAVLEGSYFDGMIDYKGSRYARLDGEEVHFCANFIHCNRSYSDALLEKGIAVVAGSYGGGVTITPAEWRKGAGLSWYNSGGCDLGRALNTWLAGVNDYITGGGDKGMEPNKSPTLARIQFAGDDGYGMGTVGRNGEGGGHGYCSVGGGK